MGRPTKIETPRSETNICTNTNHFERNRTQDRLQRVTIQESRRVGMCDSSSLTNRSIR